MADVDNVVSITESGKFGVDELGSPTTDENGDLTTEAAAIEAPPAVEEIPDPVSEEAAPIVEDSFGINEDMEAAFALEEKLEAESEEVDPEMEGLEDVSQRAQSRIRGLVEEKKALQADIGNFKQAATQQFQQAQQVNNQLNNQLQNATRQLAALQAEVRTIREVGLPQRNAEPQDPNQAVLDEFQQTTVNKAKEMLHPEIQKVQKEFQDYKKQVEQQQAEVQSKMTRQRISQQADSLVDEVLLPKEFPTDLLQQAPTGDITLHQWLGNKILSEAYSRRCSPEQAAAKLLPFYKLVGLGIMRAHAQARTGVAPSQKTTQPLTARPHAKSSPKQHSQKELRDAGFKDQLEADLAKKGLIGA